MAAGLDHAHRIGVVDLHEELEYGAASRFESWEINEPWPNDRQHLIDNRTLHCASQFQQIHRSIFIEVTWPPDVGPADPAR